jgi:hypothetical protein
MGRWNRLLALPAALLVAACASSGSSPGPSSTIAGATAAGASSAPSPTVEARPTPTPVPYGNLILYHVPPSSPSQLNGEFYLIKADGTGNTKLAPGRFAHWTADGSAVEVVAVNADCTPHLTIYPVDGSAPTQVTIAFRAGDDWFYWTPDGTRLAFFRYNSGRLAYPCASQGGMGATAAALQRDVYVVDANGSNLARVASKVPSVEESAWTPDDSSLLLIRHAAFNTTGPIVGIDTKTLTQKTVIGTGDYHDITVSPDGQLISFTRYDGTHSVWRLHVANVDGSGNRDLGSNKAWDYELVWGSDDGHATLLRGVVAANLTITGHAMWLDPTASSPTFKDLGADANTFGIDIAWSPAQDMLAYAGGKTSSVIVIAPDGTGKTALPGTAKTDWLAWQPKA